MWLSDTQWFWLFIVFVWTTIWLGIARAGTAYMRVYKKIGDYYNMSMSGGAFWWMWLSSWLVISVSMFLWVYDGEDGRRGNIYHWVVGLFFVHLPLLVPWTNLFFGTIYMNKKLVSTSRYMLYPSAIYFFLVILGTAVAILGLMIWSNVSVSNGYSIAANVLWALYTLMVIVVAIFNCIVAHRHDRHGDEFYEAMSPANVVVTEAARASNKMPARGVY